MGKATGVLQQVPWGLDSYCDVGARLWTDIKNLPGDPRCPEGNAGLEKVLKGSGVQMRVPSSPAGASWGAKGSDRHHQGNKVNSQI